MYAMYMSFCFFEEYSVNIFSLVQGFSKEQGLTTNSKPPILNARFNSVETESVK